MTDPDAQSTDRLRRVPRQERSREKLRRSLDAADHLLATEGAAALSTTRIAELADISVGSVYQYFPDKDAIAEALAVRYWGRFQELVAAVAARDEAEHLDDPVGAIIETLADAFRSAPAFRALWFGGLRTERVRDATRPTRTAVGASVERILAEHWPGTTAEDRFAVARMLVLTGDGLLREAFRVDGQGDPELLRETRRMLEAYAVDRLGRRT